MATPPYTVNVIINEPGSPWHMRHVQFEGIVRPSIDESVRETFTIRESHEVVRVSCDEQVPVYDRHGTFLGDMTRRWDGRFSSSFYKWTATDRGQWCDLVIEPRDDSHQIVV